MTVNKQYASHVTVHIHVLSAACWSIGAIAETLNGNTAGANYSAKDASAVDNTGTAQKTGEAKDASGVNYTATASFE